MLELGAGSYRPQFYTEESKIKCHVQVCRASSGSGQLVCIPSLTIALPHPAWVESQRLLTPESPVALRQASLALALSIPNHCQYNHHVN